VEGGIERLFNSRLSLKMRGEENSEREDRGKAACAEESCVAERWWAREAYMCLLGSLACLQR
jgi:hypothetical protein